MSELLFDYEEEGTLKYIEKVLLEEHKDFSEEQLVVYLTETVFNAHNAYEIISRLLLDDRFLWILKKHSILFLFLHKQEALIDQLFSDFPPGLKAYVRRCRNHGIERVLDYEKNIEKHPTQVIFENFCRTNNLTT